MAGKRTNRLTTIRDAARAQVALPCFRGHLVSWEKRVHDVEYELNVIDQAQKNITELTGQYLGPHPPVRCRARRA